MPKQDTIKGVGCSDLLGAVELLENNRTRLLSALRDDSSRPAEFTTGLVPATWYICAPPTRAASHWSSPAGRNSTGGRISWSLNGHTPRVSM